MKLLHFHKHFFHHSIHDFQMVQKITKIPIQTFHGIELWLVCFWCQAMRKGTDKDWEQRAGCMTFPDAVSKELGAGEVHPSRGLF